MTKPKKILTKLSGRGRGEGSCDRHQDHCPEPGSEWSPRPGVLGGQGSPGAPSPRHVHESFSGHFSRRGFLCSVGNQEGKAVQWANSVPSNGKDAFLLRKSCNGPVFVSATLSEHFGWPQLLRDARAERGHRKSCSGKTAGRWAAPSRCRSPSVCPRRCSRGQGGAACCGPGALGSEEPTPNTLMCCLEEDILGLLVIERCHFLCVCKSWGTTKNTFLKENVCFP